MERLNTTRTEVAIDKWPLSSPPGTIWLCVGEAGSGKTELALNLALALRQQTTGQVHLFDMDSTKAAFRSRDFRQMLTAEGVSVHMNTAMLDSPIVPDGLPEAMADELGQTVLDVGGNLAGTLCLGQFTEKLQSHRTVVMYLFNPYRALGRSGEELRRIQKSILNTIGVQHHILVVNPTMGEESDAENWQYGIEQVSKYFPEEKVALALAPRGMEIPVTDYPVFGIQPRIPTILTRKE